MKNENLNNNYINIQKQTKEMKTRKLLLSLFTATLFMTGCNQTIDQSAAEILKNQKKQNEIMETIASDEALMANMMTHMNKNNEAAKAIAGNAEMMNKVMEKEAMMNTMKGNPELRKDMMGNMVDLAAKDDKICMEMTEIMKKDEHMKSVMLDVCKNEGMMPGKGMKDPSEEHMKYHKKETM